MKIQWLGHACFLLTSESGTRIITDPYTPGAFGLDYRPVAEEADIVTVSHEHADHNNVADVKGKPQIVRGAGTQEVKGIRFKGVATYHDPSSGSQRGANTMFCFAVDGVNVCHLGDLGHDLDDRALAEAGPVDVLLVPVGGNFTIDAAAANRVCDKLKPKIVIPMHFRNDRCRNFPVADVDDFVKMRSSVKTVDGSEVTVRREELPTTVETVVLRAAR
jgi:L-ascorbate metabolism protein UlaG (beta-lactamase superfamily)